jgi:hypothetical protein
MTSLQRICCVKGEGPCPPLHFLLPCSHSIGSLKRKEHTYIMGVPFSSVYKCTYLQICQVCNAASAALPHCTVLFQAMILRFACNCNTSASAALPRCTIHPKLLFCFVCIIAASAALPRCMTLRSSLHSPVWSPSKVSWRR